MGKFNVTDKRAPRTRATSPITSGPDPSGTTYEGAPGYLRDAKSELFLLAVTNMVSEDTFYEQAKDRDGRYAKLVRLVAIADPVWMLGFLGWLRGEANMRSASLVGAAEAVFARLAAGVGPTPPMVAVTATGVTVAEKTGRLRVESQWIGNRQMVAAVLQRADEPGELLAYWHATFGRQVPMPVKNGIADAVRKLYSEFSLLKYDTASHGFRFGDVIDLVHPRPVAPWQGDLFRYALDRRHGRDSEVSGLLTMVRRQAEWRANANASPLPVEGLLDPEHIRGAGLTWEDALSLVGSKVDKARLWAALIPSMGYMALLRNLRNFDEAGVPDEVARQVAARLADPDQVAKSRQLPMRFLAAYRAAPSLRWSHALDVALNASLAHVPALAGRTLILVDTSTSMDAPFSKDGTVKRWDAAVAFGAALAARCASADLVSFSSTARTWGDVHAAHTKVFPPIKGESLLRSIERWNRRGFFLGGGTATAAALRQHYANHDRVVILTDEQAASDGHEVTDSAPTTTPIYTWNLAGYEKGHAPSGSGNRHTFGGLTDAAFQMISLIEAGRSASWPWLTD
jgi:TROVE domain-containing protein